MLFSSLQNKRFQVLHLRYVSINELDMAYYKFTKEKPEYSNKIDELGKLNKDLPTFLVITGKVVLKVLPKNNNKFPLPPFIDNTNDREFVFQEFRDDDSSFSTITRIDTLQNILEDFGLNACFVKEIILISDSSSFAQFLSTRTSAIKFLSSISSKIKRHNLLDFEALKRLNHQKRKLRSLEILSLGLLFSLVSALLLHLFLEKQSEKNEYKKNQYFVNNELLNDSVLFYQKQLNELRQIEQLSGNKSNRISILADQLAAIRPQGIVFTDLNIFPVQKEKFSLQWSKDTLGVCVLKGTVDNMQDLRHWVSVIENSDFFENVKIVDYLKVEPNIRAKYELIFSIE